MTDLGRRAAGLAVATVLLASMVPAIAHAADDLAQLRAKGGVVIGVKADYPPWGFRDAQGALTGMEIDLAQDLARRIGVPATIVSVTSANRLELLRQGQVDVVLATLGDNASRRRLVHMVEPHYYASGIALMMRGTAQVGSWDALRGVEICAKQGTYFNRQVAARYGLNLQIFKDSREAKLALRDRRCLGYLFDNSAIAADLLQPEWQDYAMPLPVLDEIGWAVALRKDAEGGDLARLAAETVADWHRSGLLLALEEKWGIRRTGFLTGMQQAWTARQPDGSLRCTTHASTTDAACYPTTVEFQPAPAVREAGPLEQKLRSLGIELTIAFDPYDSRQFLRGLGNTILLALGCLAVSIVVGIVGAALLSMPSRLLRWPAAALVEFFRYTPPLVQLYFFFFGIGALLPLVQSAGGVETPLIGNFAWAVLVLGFYAGASNAIIFRTGLSTVAAEVRDAAEAMGYSGILSYRRILLPLALRQCIGALNANLVNIVKASGVAAAIAVPELLYVTNQIWPEEGNTITMMNVLLVAFFLLVSILVMAMGRLEKRLRLPGQAT